MKNSTKKPLVAALGAAFVTSMAFAPAASADTNPFGATELETGYMVLAEGKCGEGKCGADKAAEKAKEAKCAEGKCGSMMNGKKMKKGMEKSCGAMMKGKEGACGMEKGAEKAKEAKCAEGKCSEGKCATAK